MSLSITTQPAANSLNAAYRPIVLQVGLTAAMPVVYCDIYINGIFYKSLSSTAPGLTIRFDLQIESQEYLTRFLAANGGSAILAASPLAISIFCKVRGSSTDTNGFVLVDSPIPIQATGGTPAVAGGGVESNTFYVINSTLQNEDLQDLAEHLNLFKSGTWDTNCWPLSHRVAGYRINSSDYFPIVTTDKIPVCVTGHFTMKDGSTITKSTCDSRPSCPIVTGIVITSTDNGNGTQSIQISWNTPDPLLTSISIQYRVSGSGAAWTSVSGSVTSPRTITVPVNLYDIRLLVQGNCQDTFSTVYSNIGPCLLASMASQSLPDGMSGEDYSASLPISGTGPFTLDSVAGVPAWLTTFEISGSNLVLAGAPGVDDVGDVNITGNILNCSSGSYPINLAFSIQEAAPLNVTLQLLSSPNSLKAFVEGGVPPYTYEFNCVPTGPCNSYSISNPSGSTSASEIDSNISYVLYSGTTYAFTCTIIDSVGNSATSNTVTTAACLVPWTYIDMHDGSVKQLKEIEIGMMLRDNNKVLMKKEHEVAELYIINSGLLITSRGHVNIMADGTTKQTYNLKKGEELFGHILIEDIQLIFGKFKVIDLATSNGTYFANGVLTHNKFACP